MGPVLLALPARSYCPRHKRLLVGWNGEGECGEIGLRESPTKSL
jgi:hypothetical protein